MRLAPRIRDGFLPQSLPLTKGREERGSRLRRLFPQPARPSAVAGTGPNRSAYSLGRPRLRSPIMFFWISLVPPAILNCSELITRLCHRGASGTFAAGSPNCE
jgi:hypothetical protein